MTYCSVVAVLVLVGLKKKRFGHHVILKILSLRSPSYVTAVGMIAISYYLTIRVFIKLLSPYIALLSF